jgi:hypothetical protein
MNLAGNDRVVSVTSAAAVRSAKIPRLQFWHGAEKANHTNYAVCFVRRNYIKSWNDKFTVLMNGPVVSMEAVLRIDPARPGVHRAGELGVHFVNIRLEAIYSCDINRRVDEPDAWGQRSKIPNFLQES